ncbi:amidohydrolase [Olivibacter ginsenosidimutans]|uniref:Amidohydrolase n=2 Tax=Olivibacter ginsenosidimutans TaxID=1176537 RepID=A0ABP9B0J7_9SPHI
MVFQGCNKKERVDLVVHHARIYTVDSLFRIQEAVAIKDGKFIAVGKNDEITNMYEGKEALDAHGKPIYPGFYDAHCHFFAYAQGKHEVDLTQVSSETMLVERVKAFRQKYPNDAWIIGHGWDQNLWKNKQFPTNDALNKAFPDVPVYLSRVDGHAALVNQKALELAKISADVKLQGGLAVRQQGKFTGILIDNAMDMVQAIIPDPSEESLSNMLLTAEKDCLAVGLTTLADAGLPMKSIELLKKLYQENKLKINTYAMVMLNPDQLDEVLKKGVYTSKKLDVRSFKIVADGALGSRGACLLAPYADAPTSGFLLQSPQLFDAMVAKVAKSNFQLNVHAIGDSTNRFVLHTFRKYLPKESDRRWRIEHAQIIAPPDFDLFVDAGIIPSIQPSHATSDMYWAVDRLGKERMAGAYAYKQLLQKAGLVAFGSDFPVEAINPLYQFHAAVARRDQHNLPEEGFQMQGALSREEALKGLTIWAAYACFKERESGSIETGKTADFVLLDQDIIQIPLNKIRQTKVMSTWIDGKVAWYR